MKLKLAHTKQYLLLVDEEVEIKDGDFYYDKGDVNGIASATVLTDKTYYRHKILAYLPLTPEATELPLPLLPPIEEDVDVEKQVANILDSPDPDYDDVIYKGMIMFGIECYKAAVKQFTLEDMHKAIEMARKGRTCIGGSSTDAVDDGEADDCVDWNYTSDQIIQSLSTQKLPKEFVPELSKDFDKNPEFYGTGMFNSHAWKLKFTEDSNGIRTIVGTYKY